MMTFKHKKAIDWDLMTRFKARRLVAGLRQSMPGQWGKSIEILAALPEAVPVWLRAREWLERVEEFKRLHGDAGEWNLSDCEVMAKAKAYAEWTGQLFELKSPVCIDAEKVDKVCAICDLVGVEYPRALTAAGAVNRILCPVWWRRVLRKKVARVVEAGAIKLGLVNRRDGGYCSQSAIQRRKHQNERNAAMLEKTLIRNEAGQVFKLSELAARSTANPEIRGGELMVRIRGCEEFADKAGHVGYFLTLTCPSMFHAVQSGGKGPRAVMRVNPKYDGVSTPRDAQAWLCAQWAKTRAAWARESIKAYGFRVAEPHHDGCPHWHALLWFADDVQAFRALQILGDKWLSDGGAVVSYPSRESVIVYKSGTGAEHEKGSLKNRLNVKRMYAGGAAGYVAKYVAKSIGHFDVGVQLDQTNGETWEVDTRDVKGWQRVDAWASTWGIRQFQAIGQPSVTVWREMRRVTSDQIEKAIHCGDGVASKVWHATQKIGAVAADWCRFMLHQGGPCLKRGAYVVQASKRINEVVNGYGELITRKTVIGCELKSGRVLVSRRQLWGRVGAGEGSEVLQSSEEREALGAPWTRFNNCTARIMHAGRAALAGLKSAADFPKWGALYEVDEYCRA